MKICTNTVNGLINFEMDLHIKLCKKYGISKKDLILAEEKNKKPQILKKPGVSSKKSSFKSP